ncbi:putative DNA-binding transcriptional regulator [Variovorax sp. PBL-H6]|uniref:TetR/AcrR family transcriptional regulator n=1 Tax=Variovorax sp. PBL-H6 TaxID=434009 RepID=UPI0013160EF5|nr:TetR/AcrR family transcriptional regulator [Variovorax sp. PBL-H6]VTU24028.1 putative DNA-binding transcriptional regulator [Variovorax sp. PBL-H6]
MPTATRKKAPASRAVRAPRPDGAATRALLLEIAGQVFAERGYADATSKEICERAGTPMASVNYHFGSREALYEEVLVEAHRQIVSVDELVEMTRALGDPRDKLRALLGHMVAPSPRGNAPWGFRVVLREMMSPGPLAPALVEKAVRPKAKLLLGLLAEILQLPADHPAVQRALVFSVLPCIVLLVAPKEIPRKVLPAMAKDSEGMIEDLMRYVFAGLAALAKAHRR